MSSLNTISLHVRRGDYVSNPTASAVHGTCTLDYYRNAITHINKKVHRPKFLVFSDDIEWCVSSLSHMLPSDTVFVDFNEHGYLDLHLMSHCKHNIIANSSFSWWGAWLNDFPDKIVIAPAQWTVYSDSDDWTPREWVRIKG